MNIPRLCFLVFFLLGASSGIARAADPVSADPPADAKNMSLPQTIEPGTRWMNPDDWSLHFQTTAVAQADPSFHAAYAGPNSLRSHGEISETVSSTLFLGRRLWQGGELYINPELAQGQGLTNTLGVASFPNGEATRAGNLKTSLLDRAFLWNNICRFFLRQTFNFGEKTERVEGDINQLPGTQSTSRLTITAGKISATDIFDNNAYSHDARSQFMSWSLISNGAWDYPADAKGYTNGLAVEYNYKRSALRWGGFMEPRTANSSNMDWRLWKSLGNVLELEQGYDIFSRDGKVRVLGFMNRAHMGSYKDAVSSPDVDITESRKYRLKSGFGIDLEQALTQDLGFFSRLGWNDGRTESWMFTEIDRSFTAGLSLKGTRWHRGNDTLGVGWALNGLSKNHENYLKAGGSGFIIGDGALNYSLEKDTEAYYNIHLIKKIFVGLDYQLINDPAYNAARGPVSVFATRLHLEF